MKKTEYVARLRELGKMDKEAIYPFDILSKRELEVTVAIALGWTPAKTADVLGIAAKSFGTYRGRILDKLRLNTNAELAVMAFEVNLIPSVLNAWKEREHEHLMRDGGGSGESTGREGGLLPGAEAEAPGRDGNEAVPGGNERDAAE